MIQDHQASHKSHGGTAHHPVVYFFHPEAERWKKLFEANDIEEALSHIRGGRDAWIITTYLMLQRLRQFPVELIDRFIPDTFCICHFDDLPSKRFPWKSYLVVIRADRDRALFCDAEIVQSPGAIEHRSSYYIPHWTQPGLVRRIKKSEHRIQQLGYFGELKNLSAKFRHHSFQCALQELGINLVVRESPTDWSDYSDIDVVLAVRDGSDYFLASKPPTKLFNAWIAGVPILVGTEPAYSYYRKSQLDYFEVSSSEEVIFALKILIANEDLYHQMVSNGFQRALEIDREATTEAWRSLIMNTLYPQYLQAAERPMVYRAICHYVRHSFRKLRKILRGNMYVRGFDNDGNPTPKQTKLARRLARYLDKHLLSIFD